MVGSKWANQQPGGSYAAAVEASLLPAQPGEQARLAVSLGRAAPPAGRKSSRRGNRSAALPAASRGHSATPPGRARRSGGHQSRWSGAGTWSGHPGRGRLRGVSLLLRTSLQAVQVIGGGSGENSHDRQHTPVSRARVPDLRGIGAAGRARNGSLVQSRAAVARGPRRGKRQRRQRQSDGSA